MIPREQLKQRTRTAIASAASELFLAHGFSQVTLQQIAEAAGVSRRTVSAYFPVKEDLVVDRFVDREHQIVRIAAVRIGKDGALDSLHDHFQLGLLTRDPLTGLNDDKDNLNLYRMIRDSESLQSRLYSWAQREEDALTWALDKRCEGAVHPEVSRSVAVMALGQLGLLARENWGVMLEGKSADDHYAYAVERADDAFDLLKTGADGLHNLPEHPDEVPED